MGASSAGVCLHRYLRSGPGLGAEQFSTPGKYVLPPKRAPDAGVPRERFHGRIEGAETRWYSGFALVPARFSDRRAMSQSSPRSRTTLLLQSADSPEVQGLLFPLVYEELRDLAHRQLSRERGGHTLQTTALVHEAFLRLVDDTQVGQRGRAYFFAAAGRAMRQVLVDYARRRNANKRKAELQPLDLDSLEIGVDSFAHELVELDLALTQLAELNARHAQVVECRFFAGMSVEETAEALAVSERTVKSDWALARAWLYDQLFGKR